MLPYTKRWTWAIIAADVTGEITIFVQADRRVVQRMRKCSSAGMTMAYLEPVPLTIVLEPASSKTLCAM